MTVVSLELRHPGGVTQVVVGADALETAAFEVDDFAAGRSLFRLSTPTLRRLHSERLETLGTAAKRVVDLEAPDGEEAKAIEQASRLWQEMLGSGGKRDSRLLAIGGGALTDLGGFVAGTFLRGIEVALVPTTLLGMVDAALGGKTAIDLPQAKNSVGVFHQPRLIVVDTRFLESLPVGERRSGAVEAIKKATLLDRRLFEQLEAGLDGLLAGDPLASAPLVAGAAAAKCRVVEADPSEKGLRKVLNFGHTLGHAIEGVLGFRELRHGEAIAYGMLFVLRLAERRGLDRECARRLRDLLARLELPPLPLGAAAVDELIAFMARDKKATESGLTWVLPLGFESYVFESQIGLAEIRSELAAFLVDPC